MHRVLLGPGQLVGKLVGVLRLMVASNRDTHDAYELPTRLLSRLVLGHEVFGRQFVEAGKFSQTYGRLLTVILHTNGVPCCWNQGVCATASCHGCSAAKTRPGC